MPPTHHSAAGGSAVVFWLTLAALVFLLLKFKWIGSVNKVFNTTLVSLYTPEDILPIGVEEKMTFDGHALRGFAQMRTRKVLIVGLVRDVESTLPHLIRKTERVGEAFADYRIILVENDSRDQTRSKILQWGRSNPRVVLLGCGVNAQECRLSLPGGKGDHDINRTRIGKMVYLRNIYLDAVRRFDAAEWPYTILWDLDILGSAYLDGIANTISRLEEDPSSSAMCAYGAYHVSHYWNNHYDNYAALLPGEEYRHDLSSLHYAKTISGMTSLPGSEPFQVESCFGGFTLYRTAALQAPGVRYDMSPQENIECEHVRLHAKLPGRIFCNPGMIHMVLVND